ncbi:TetR family transcriptional regulator C-terminal domain-containing protein [Nocardia nova]|uniref:TetR family transcriptional regulator C-terminal domain-containing protein n=1 Tax=Nocardia nova TaxID=37330 RepID=UPI0015E470C4|nr:TetR family transcriptional regulator C-terminal domain-containing protein [Nocardia nova]
MTREDRLARALVAVNPDRSAESAESADAAAELLALLDGLTLAVLTEPDRMPPARARRIGRDWTDRWAGR